MFCNFTLVAMCQCRFVWILFAFAFLSSCQLSNIQTVENTQPKKPTQGNVSELAARLDHPFPVALLLPYDADDPSINKLSQSLENAAQMAVRDAKSLGIDVDLRVYSTGANPIQAGEIAIQSIQEGAKVILGPLYAEHTLRVVDSVRAADLPLPLLLSLSNTPNVADVDDRVFTLGTTQKNTADRVVHYATERGYKRFMVIYPDTASGRTARSVVVQSINNTGGQIVADKEFQFSQQGIVDALLDLTETAQSTQAQVLFFTSETTAGLPLLSQLLKENLLPSEQFQFAGLTHWDVPKSGLQAIGLQNGWFATFDPTAKDNFERRYFDTYGVFAEPLSGLAYDGIAVIATVLRNGGLPTQQALLDNQIFTGVYGLLWFQNNGVALRALAMATIKEQQVVIIDPATTPYL